MAKSYMGLSPGEGLGNLLSVIMGKPGDEAKRLQSTAYAANVRSEMDKRDQEIAALVADRSARTAAQAAVMDPNMPAAEITRRLVAAGYGIHDAAFLAHAPDTTLGLVGSRPGVDRNQISDLAVAAKAPATTTWAGQQIHEGAETGRAGIHAGATIRAAQIAADERASHPIVVDGHLVHPQTGASIYDAPYNLATGVTRFDPVTNEEIAHGQTSVGANQVVYSPTGEVKAQGPSDLAPDHFKLLPPGFVLPDSTSVTTEGGGPGQPSVVFGGPKTAAPGAAGRVIKPLAPSEEKAVRDNFLALLPPDVAVPEAVTAKFMERFSQLYTDVNSPHQGDAMAASVQAKRDVLGDTSQTDAHWYTPFGTTHVVPREAIPPLAFTPGGNQRVVQQQGRQPGGQAPAQAPDATGPGGVTPPQYAPDIMVKGAQYAIAQGRTTRAAALALLQKHGITPPAGF